MRSKLHLTFQVPKQSWLRLISYKGCPEVVCSKPLQDFWYPTDFEECCVLVWYLLCLSRSFVSHLAL